MLVLAFDTATPAITVAIHDGSATLAQTGGEGAMAHGEQLVPFMEAALREADVSMQDITDIAVGVGPGPFTGLRVGVVTALTLGSTLGIAQHGVCTLDIIAAEARSSDEFLVATDARRKEVYWAKYGADGVRLTGPAVLRPADLAAKFPNFPVYGRGAVLYDDVLQHAAGPVDPSAGKLAEMVASGNFTNLPLEPLYLRRPDAATAAGIKRA